MTAYSFTSIIGTSQAFSASGDTLTFTGSAASYSFTEDSGNLVITNSSSQSATLTGVTLAQLTASNMLFADSSNLLVGDNTTGTTDDDLAQLATGALDLVTAGGANVDADNLIFGMGDGDYIALGAGNNVIFGGNAIADSADGSDTIVIDSTGTTSGSNRIYGNGGNDTFLFNDPTGAAASTTVYGGLGADDFVIGAAAGDLLLYGNAGVDTVQGASATGNMTIYGGNGIVDSTDAGDLITSGLGNTTVFGNAGDDDLNFDDFASGSSQTFYAGLGDDTIDGDVGGTGSSGTLLIYGNAGGDTIDVTTHAGAVTVYGGNGLVDTSDGADTITIGTGNTNHDATVISNAGADSITSSAGLASGETLLIYAGAGADTITISGARSVSSSLTVYGNGDNDTFALDDSALTEDATTTFGDFEEEDILQVTLDGGTATDLTVTGLGASVTFDNTAANGKYVFSNYTGNFTATNLVFSDGAVLLTNFGASSTSLSGTVNNDQIITGAEGDTVSAGDGADIITGGDGADSLDGGAGNDSIVAGEGNDSVNGGDGANTINGGTGSDLITGGADAETIDGSNGHDTIVGGLGADNITGGSENDTFSYAVAEVDVVAGNVDTITDAFTGSDVFAFSDLTASSLRGDGTDFASGNGTSAQALGANVGLYVATNAAGSLTEAGIYTALSGIADDFAASDIIYAMVSDGTNGALVRITESANAGTLVAVDDTMEFVANLSGVTTATLSGLVQGNFADFT